MCVNATKQFAIETKLQCEWVNEACCLKHLECATRIKKVLYTNQSLMSNSSKSLV